MRLVARPVRALHVIIGAQEGRQALRRLPHVGIGVAGGIVVLVMLARLRQVGQRLRQAAAGRRRTDGHAGAAPRLRHGRGAGERRAHQGGGAEDVRPQQGGPGRHGRAEIVADHRGRMVVPQGHDQAHRIPHQPQHAEGPQVGVIAARPAGGEAIAALVRRHHVKARLGQLWHDPAPGPGQFRKAVQQQEQRPVAAGARLQQVHPQAIDPVDEARRDPGRQGHAAIAGRGPGRSIRHPHIPRSPDRRRHFLCAPGTPYSSGNHNRCDCIEGDTR